MYKAFFCLDRNSFGFREAIDAIYEYAEESWVTNLLCENALLTAHVEELRPIPASIIRRAATEFYLQQTAPALAKLNVAALTDRDQ